MMVAFTSAVARVREGEGIHDQRKSVLGDVGDFADRAEVGDGSHVDEEGLRTGSDLSSVKGGGPGAAGTSSYAGGASGGSSSSIREGGLGRIIVQRDCSRLNESAEVLWGTNCRQ